MHVLYVDDSGSVGNVDERFFVLGAVCVFERGIFHLMQELDRCVVGFALPQPDDLELHGSEMYSGRRRWRAVRERSVRERFIGSALSIIAQPRPAVRLFAVIIDKAAVSPHDPVRLAFEELCNRFNLFLQRTGSRSGDYQRGLIVMDESKHEQPLQAMARNFGINGATWGKFRHLAEVPLFVDSRATRLVQAADLVAWATWRRYEHKDARFFNPLLPRFDADGGVIHGLLHKRGTRDRNCDCPACGSRRQIALAR